jgi:hypothetical protein
MLKKVACILLLVACDSDEAPVTTTATTAPAITVTAPQPAAEPTPAAPTVVATPTVADNTAPPAAPVRTVTGTWRDRVSADLDALRTSSPQLLADLTQLAPTMTRARFARFTSDAIHDPRAASVFLNRLARGGESEQVRAALVEALPRTGGTFADAAVDLLASETSSLVRGSYVFAARRAPAAQARILIKRGLEDTAAEVQAEAARTAAAHPSGKQLATELRATLSSSDPAVRTEVARTLGILAIADARDALVAMLDDASADVRLESLRAIDRIQPGFAKTLPLGTLATDADPRIAALVARLTGSTAPAPTQTQTQTR